MEPQDFDSYRMPISKTSGKETAFIIFVNREGKRKFMNEHGHRYSARNGHDMAIMHNYWMNTDQSTKDYYRTIELSDHNSLENRTKRRHEHENRRRIIAHQKAEEEYETRQTHRANVQFQQNEKLRAHGPQFIPDPKRAWDANTLFEKDFTEYCIKRRKELSELFKNKLESPDPSNLAELREETFCFVGVSICGYSEIVNEDVKKEDLYTVPREISIVNFTLKAGITSVTTILLDADPGIYNPDFNEEFQKDNIRETSEYLGLKPPIYDQGKEDVEDAWHMFKAAWGTRKKSSTEKARILCEKKFFNIVSFTFNRIANIAGMAEWRIHSESIQKGMVPIEDFILALKDAASCSIPDADVLEKYVQKNYVPRLRDNHYCAVHIHQEGDKDLRCQQARGAMAIHGLFAFLRDQKIFGFDEEYDDILHNLCTERKKKIAEPATGNNFLEVGYRRSNRYLDFTLVPSITAKDPTPDTRHMSQFRRAFDNPTSSKWRQPLLEEEDDDDERLNEDEGRAADENDSEEEGLPPIRRRPFNQNGFDQSSSNRAIESVHGATFGIDSNNQQQSFKQSNFAASSRSHVPTAHKPNQENWIDPSLLSRPATVSSLYRSGSVLSYRTACETSGGFRNQSSCQGSFQSRSPSTTNGFLQQSQGGFQNRPQSTNSFQPQFQGSFQNGPSSTNSFLQQPRGGFQNQASGGQGGSQIVRPGYTTTRASPPQHRKFVPNHDISKPKNSFSPRYNFSYNVKINWRPYTGDITEEKLLCPDGLIDPFNYESFPNALA